MSRRTSLRKKAKTRPLRRLLLVSSVLSAFFAAPLQAVPGGSRVAIEIGSKAERAVDPRLTRRLIQLELGDVDVPAPAAGLAARHPPALFFRVLSTAPDVIRVELWERGEFHGARSVSLARGTPQHHARRIALSAAELARRLRRKRLAEAAQPKADPDADSARNADRARIGVSASARVASIGPGEAWLAGPALGGVLRIGGARLELGASWLWGAAPALSGDPLLEWLELQVSPGISGEISQALELSGGAQFAAAAVHMSDVRAVDGIDHAEDTWSARAALYAKLEPRLGPKLALSVGPEIGVMLRRIPVVDTAGSEERVGGVWVGGALGLVFDPARP